MARDEPAAMIFTAEQKRQAVVYRQRVFKRLVETGKMKQSLMDEQIAIFEAIRDDYSKAEQSERLI